MPSYWECDEDLVVLWSLRMRVLFFDPQEVYSRIEGAIDIFKRIQEGIKTSMLFPKRDDGFCRCGCGMKAKRMWANKSCCDFAYEVYYIIVYGTQHAKRYIETYYGKRCVNCNNSYDEIDHIIPVKYGGGGCWLSNYAPLCKKCHIEKTRKDFGIKNQQSLF